MTEYAGYRNVWIIHPETGATAEVPDSALAQHYLGGWTLMAPEGFPKREVPEGVPEPLTASEVADRLRQRAAELAPPAATPADDGKGGKQAGGPARSAGKSQSASASEE